MYKTFRGQTNGSFKTQKMNDREFLVVPVIAMVEGVRYGANQDSPELGLASEFGHFPDSWNNRPIVLGHPKVNNSFVSAGSPAVMDEYSIGTTMNAKLSGKKLKLEAWLETSMEDKSDASKEMFKRLRDNEMVEVSVGFFTDVEESTGKYNGQEYNGIWRNIATDHLAFLAAGTTGACSIEDGCGAPRVNELKLSGDVITMATDTSKPYGNVEYADPGYQKDKKKRYPIDTAEHIRAAWDYIHQAKNAAKYSASQVSAIKKKIIAAWKSKIDKKGPPSAKVNEMHVECECQDTNETTVVGLESYTPEELAGLDPEFRDQLAMESIYTKLITQAVPNDVMSSDIHKHLDTALNKDPNTKYAYLIGYTPTNAVYSAYNSQDDGSSGWGTYQRAFNMDSDGNTTFTSDPQEVRLVSRVVPVGNDAGADNVNAQTTQMEDIMTTNTTGSVATAAAKGSAAAVAGTTDNNEAGRSVADIATVNVNVTTEVKQLSVQEYIDNAPKEIQEILTQSMQEAQKRKDALVANLKKNPRNSFSEDYLKSQTVVTLESLSKLADIPVANYAGVAMPSPVAQQTEEVPMAPLVFERKNIVAA